MDHLQKFAVQIRTRQVILLLFSNGLIIGGWWYGSEVAGLDNLVLLWLLVSTATFLSIVLAVLSTQTLIRPLRLVWQAVMHVAPETANTPAPNPASLHVGRELLTSLISHIYQLAQVVYDVEKISNKRPRSLEHDFVATSIPLPLVVLDKNQNIIFANNAMALYVERDIDDIVGQNVYSVLDMSFSNKDTLEEWLKSARSSKIVGSRVWDRVRITVNKNTVRQFDLTGYYNKNNPNGYETMLTLFDRTKQYGQDDQGLSFVALAVHELRTPITLLRGYIEAFEEELDGQLTPELVDFMRKMKASAQQLTIFINNILNVARIENNQLTLQLQKEDWPLVVQAVVSDMELQANTRQVELVAEIANDLPPVGIDTVSMYEALNNLIDNAIKYSRPGSKVIIKVSLTSDGMIETTVQDFGIGMPANIVSNLFEKFYRSYHSKTTIGGTGLGLYLCKAIVEAHGGNIWVRSTEGQGSTFGFTIKPYSQVDEEQKNSDNEGIVRRAHGWIKNHSLYRG